MNDSSHSGTVLLLRTFSCRPTYDFQLSTALIMGALILRRRRTQALLLGILIVLILFKISNWFAGTPPEERKRVSSYSQYWDLLPKHRFRRPHSVPGNSDKHRYRPDGLLEVNMGGSHPIYELMARAEKRWYGKLSKASKTLEEAVAEYRRRYERPPPKGFELW